MDTSTTYNRNGKNLTITVKPPPPLNPAAALTYESDYIVEITGQNNQRLYTGKINNEIAIFLRETDGKETTELLRLFGEYLADKRKL